jgi:hypothetical protein
MATTQHSGRREGTNREGNQQADGNARSHGNGGLLVVLRGEYLGVLEGPMGCCC